AKTTHATRPSRSRPFFVRPLSTILREHRDKLPRVFRGAEHEARRDQPGAVFAKEAFGLHGQRRWRRFRASDAATAGPGGPVLWLSDDGQRGGCHLVTANRGADA